MGERCLISSFFHTSKVVTVPVKQTQNDAYEHSAQLLTRQPVVDRRPLG